MRNQNTQFDDNGLLHGEIAIVTIHGHNSEYVYYWHGQEVDVIEFLKLECGINIASKPKAVADIKANAIFTFPALAA